MSKEPRFDEATGTYMQESDSLIDKIELEDSLQTSLSDGSVYLTVPSNLTGAFFRNDPRSAVPNGILSDECIDIYAQEGMIENYLPEQVREIRNAENDLTYRALSAGLTSYGYDVRLSDKFEMMVAYPGQVVDPKRPNPKLFAPLELQTDPSTGERYVELPAGSYLLGHTIEYFNMPKDVVAQCIGKSTYARHGVLVNVTPIEPGFCGQVVIEIFNCSPSPLRIYAYEGIAQFMFFKGPCCKVSYADRNGKYQGQTGIRHGEVG